MGKKATSFVASPTAVLLFCLSRLCLQTSRALQSAAVQQEHDPFDPFDPFDPHLVKGCVTIHTL